MKLILVKWNIIEEQMVYGKRIIVDCVYKIIMVLTYSGDRNKNSTRAVGNLFCLEVIKKKCLYSHHLEP